ncbi:unnamed protein product [Echinostoma caproni]|uniref:Uncharacterized protein n=1 Tax=Echinostoma caproni TaxID=27848 RepID=A0A183BBU9_9TREM|nr:unnamed protein product [Echinostoma caproni]
MKGGRLTQPEICTLDVYMVMVKCEFCRLVVIRFFYITILCAIFHAEQGETF